MNYSYFPGCTLKTKGAQLDRAGRLAAEKLKEVIRQVEI